VSIFILLRTKDVFADFFDFMTASVRRRTFVARVSQNVMFDLKSDRGLPIFALDGLRRSERGYHGLATKEGRKEEEPFPVLIVSFFALISGIRVRQVGRTRPMASNPRFQCFLAGLVVMEPARVAKILSYSST
jgi:hypothetical protein